MRASPRDLPSTEYVREYLDYNPDTGIFTWRRASSRKTRVGTVAGCVKSVEAPYVVIRLNKILYRAHRLAFVWMGVDVPEIIDHKDRNPYNNRWENLRGTSLAMNALNSTKHWDSKSPYQGVTYDYRYNKWTARVAYNGKQFWLGYFNEAEEASEVYQTAKGKLMESLNV